jgi:hypothetical protein
VTPRRHRWALRLPGKALSRTNFSTLGPPMHRSRATHARRPATASRRSASCARAPRHAAFPQALELWRAGVATSRFAAPPQRTRPADAPAGTAAGRMAAEGETGERSSSWTPTTRTTSSTKPFT